ncbi:ChaC-like protein [Pseudovibrio sp. W64]|uniref:gamma-glutamylcyclotransferase n=2 Tax=Pseudovibrio TaxID=258255 RepID=UPI0007B1B34A|nr:ChaC-like protein [Pseudovibrio sp. Ad13]KZK87882.1 ChaC-like protein [Pseudovibrio sp. W64]KZK93746.1 ChaC-like protein [Pseudovibrio sp. W74]KZK95886.1 ChaC-like protein [Pseudovibrio sp. Ad46]KZL12069.1 ChaC-like protein [Pseudovibrio sp. Ad14]
MLITSLIGVSLKEFYEKIVMRDLWIFGYGSLIWRPGFTFEQAVPAILHGVHRSLCVYSWVHRGTQDNPGLVFGLDKGGACIGMAFRVSPENWQHTLGYLREREQQTMVYLETHRRVRLLDEEGTKVRAVTFVADQKHEQYAGALPLKDQLQIVKGAVGQSGANPEYVLNTHAHMKEMGIKDQNVEWLARQLSI